MGSLTINIHPDGTEVWREVRKTGVTPQDGGTTTTLFTVTGDVIVKIVGVCKTSLTTSDAITVEVGTSGSTQVFIVQIANATTLIATELWFDATPTTSAEKLPNSSAMLQGVYISGGQDVILTPSGTFTAGVIDFYCTWKPLSADGLVVAA